jgi:hypothetical protein
MIPEFDDNGNPPPGIHRCTMDELKARFGRGSPERKVETAELIEFVVWAKQAGVLRLLVDGSFTTAKKAPNDVDVVVLRPDPPNSFTGPIQDTEVRWPFIHVASAADEADLERWAFKDFGFDRNGNSRGILEILL